MHIFTQKDTSVFIQFQLGETLYYLGECVDLESIPNPRLGGIDLIQCRNRNGRGYKTLGKKYSPPGSIEVTISELDSDVVSWLSKIQCPFTLYALQRTCGDAGVAKNWTKGAIVYDMEITADNLNTLAHHLDENETVHEWTLVGIPPRVDVHEITVSREAIVGAQPLLSVANSPNLFCDDDCGAYKLPCDEIWAGAASAVAPGTPDLFRSVDNGTTWAATATDPFTGAQAGRSIAGVAVFEISQGVNRIYVMGGTLAATKLYASYSDDNGATWTMVEIAASIAAEAPGGPKAFQVIDQNHMWVGTDSGNIFFSSNGGVSWALQGITTGAADVNAMSFADEDVGMAVCDGDTIMLTIDGGLHWTAGTATGSGVNLLSCKCFNQNQMLVGTAIKANAALYLTHNGTTTWSVKRFTGDDLESVTDMEFATNSVGYIATNTAGPVGSLHMTIDGGANWKELSVPANSGLNAIVLCSPTDGFVVGPVNTATPFIAHFG